MPKCWDLPESEKLIYKLSMLLQLAYHWSRVCTALALRVYTIWTRCVKTAFQTPSSNSCSRLGASMEWKLKPNFESHCEKAFWETVSNVNSLIIITCSYGDQRCQIQKILESIAYNWVAPLEDALACFLNLFLSLSVIFVNIFAALHIIDCAKISDLILLNMTPGTRTVSEGFDRCQRYSVEYINQWN